MRPLDELEPIEQDLETYRPVKSLFWYPPGLYSGPDTVVWIGAPYPYQLGH